MTSRLKHAMRHQYIVWFLRRFEDTPVRGYVVDVGPHFFPMVLVSDRIWFDGFECFRLGDVRGLRRDQYWAFSEAALKKRRERKPTRQRLSVTSIEELLRSAGRVFPLVTIHRELVDPDVCWIGRVLGVARGRVSLLQIGPGAAWDKKPTEYKVSEITRVNFGGDYENALYLVGGKPKS